MTSSKLVLMLGAAAVALPGAALAQSQNSSQTASQTPPPATTSQPAAQTAATTAQTPAPLTQTTEPAQQQQPASVGDVVVNARAADVRTSIDSTSYSLANDLQATTGTLADALRNIPSVEVDPDGNVSLRGDSNVTILIDGRPATQFNGPSRGQMIQQIPAAQYARIEVMTNPSAAYSPEGSGGVINLISKPTTVRPTQTTNGSIRANVGDGGRYNIGANIAHVNGKTTLTADVGIRHDGYLAETNRVRERLDTGSGRFLESRQSQDIDGASDSAYLRLSAQYDLDAKTQLVGELRHTDVDAGGDGVTLYEADNAAGGIGSAYRRSGDGRFKGQFSGATARVLRRFDDQGHEWTNEVRFDRNNFNFTSDSFVDQQIPVAANFIEATANENHQDQWGVTSAYVRPLSDGGKLRLGYELQATLLELDNRVARGPTQAALTPDPLVSNRFDVDQVVHALYVTYEKPFSEKLSAQFGLRLEQTNLDLNQVTSGVKTSQDYFRAYPTGHLSYKLNDKDTVRASYSRRIQRPGPADLNPFLTYGDPQNYRSGNPDLEPQETDSYELNWQRRVQQTFYQATLYYRDTNKAFTQTTVDLGNGVFLTRPENLGASTSTGLELVANGPLLPTLRYSASLNVYRQEIDAAGIVGAQDRSGDAVSGRLSLNWQPTPKDFVQISGVWSGDQLLAQGVREQSTLVNLGYRRKLNDAWSMQMTVRDLFDDFGSTTTLTTPTFRDRSEQTFGGRAAYIGLTWNFGGGQRRPEQFDFQGPTTGG
ncbi:Outer membrane cobalamin receptor protein [Brevundimonas vesicularis]|uniref:Outer membrane cobalamin receptor protein n=1 Tax=Brevundimonas vesicularis TaxID=41276 RepID=A0A2X1D9S2_BREVE|nr:outer membrane beta-barrel family protein [Brevundimonas vesicularis]SPU55596.1 Outer membrane cobalamin receptor protein [Brevundimonas vesicularis]